MQSDNTLNNIAPEEQLSVSDDEVHAQARKYIDELNQLVFNNLPEAIAKIIDNQLWKKKETPYENFGDYAIDKSSDGLGIANNEMLWLLRSTMKTNTDYVSHWGDVLSSVEKNVRSYAKKNKIPVKNLNRDLSEQEEVNQQDEITYLPSRSKSSDGHLMKLKKKEPDLYQNVVQGKVDIKDTFIKKERKIIPPIEAMKNKFSSLSDDDRQAFLEWIENEMS